MPAPDGLKRGRHPEGLTCPPLPYLFRCCMSFIQVLHSTVLRTRGRASSTAYPILQHATILQHAQFSAVSGSLKGTMQKPAPSRLLVGFCHSLVAPQQVSWKCWANQVAGVSPDSGSISMKCQCSYGVINKSCGLFTPRIKMFGVCFLACEHSMFMDLTMESKHIQHQSN